MSDFDLTAEEAKAIASLKRVAAKWPDSLWLFSASGTLCVMRKVDGEHMYIWSGGYEGVDQDYIVTTVSIENDGGDF